MTSKCKYYHHYYFEVFDEINGRIEMDKNNGKNTVSCYYFYYYLKNTSEPRNDSLIRLDFFLVGSSDTRHKRRRC